jgi:putative polymerase
VESNWATRLKRPTEGVLPYVLGFHVWALSEIALSTTIALWQRVKKPLSSTAFLDRSDQAQAYTTELKWVAGALIIAAITFNAALCFINTHVTPINNSHVIFSEISIIIVALLACYRNIEPQYILLIVVYVLLLALIRVSIFNNPGMDLKTIRDFLIPLVFIAVGKSVSNIRVADATVYVATIIILLFAIFEYFFIDAYLEIFRVIEYYVARGTLDPLNPQFQWSKGLMLNGIRHGGGALLPFLGDHRVSSLFLESISLGNFGSLVVFWAIARSRMEQQLRVWSIISGIALIILSDSRFNAAFIGVGILFLFINPRVTTPVVVAMPFVMIFGLWLIAANAPVREVLYPEDASLHERLLYSGRVLLDFDFYNWLGAKASRNQTLDAGYAYVISNIGLIGFVVYWFWFISLEGRSRYFYAFRNMSAAYFAALFCISTSVFTIKTAAMLWFLIGALSGATDRERIRA